MPRDFAEKPTPDCVSVWIRGEEGWPAMTVLPHDTDFHGGGESAQTYPCGGFTFVAEKKQTHIIGEVETEGC